MIESTRTVSSEDAAALRRSAQVLRVRNMMHRHRRRPLWLVEILAKTLEKVADEITPRGGYHC